jgi:hypothetical protein
MVATHTGMTDQTSSNIARDGAAKRPQTSFPPRVTMRDRTAEMAGVSPTNPGVGPDAAPANPLSPCPGMKHLPKPATKWGMKGAVDHDLGSRVLSEAANLGKMY